MKIIETDIEEVVIIEPKVVTDERGYFLNPLDIGEKVCKTTFVQVNESKSIYGVLIRKGFTHLW